MILGVLGISLLTLVACIAPIKAPVQGAMTDTTTDTLTPVTTDGAVTIVGGDDVATLQNFLARWLAPVYPGMPDTQITVTVGALPANLPISLTLPNTITVVGAFVQTGEYENTQLLLSTEQAAEAALATVNEQLAAQGFTQPETQPGVAPGGFQPSEPAPSTLCRAADDLAANLFSATSSAGLTDIRLSFSSFDPYGGPCAGPSGPTQGQPAVLPTLRAPANAIVRSSSSGYGGNQAEVTAEIEFAEDVATLTAHYDAQLVEAGWEQVAASAADNITWSTWTLVDEEGDSWNITFYIVRQAAESDTYLATLRLRRAR
ncbi:MAG: hypothetical protein DYG89_34525 [Caldilinea sp. CFX5]|nr:hypothetical protein [Caldilinea sp. CFX5]